MTIPAPVLAVLANPCPDSLNSPSSSGGRTIRVRALPEQGRTGLARRKAPEQGPVFYNKPQ